MSNYDLDQFISFIQGKIECVYCKKKSFLFDRSYIGSSMSKLTNDTNQNEIRNIGITDFELSDSESDSESVISDLSNSNITCLSGSDESDLEELNNQIRQYNMNSDLYDNYFFDDDSI